MRIGLVTDTHVPWEEKELPREVLKAFEGVDLILHGGDIYSHVVLDDLETIAPVLAALGDDDYPDEDPRVQESHVMTLDGHRVWLVHEGPYFPIEEKWLDLWWQNRISKDDPNYGKPDIIVCGHAHAVMVERSGGVLYVNSGSPTILHYKKGLGTVGILELSPGQADVQIIQLKKSD